MEGLRAQAKSALAELKFDPVAKEHEFITATSGESVEVNRVAMPIADIVLSCSAMDAPAPSFRLAKINFRNNDPNKPWRSPNTSKEELLQLWEAFGMEPYQLYLISRCVRGFQQLHLPGSGADKQHYFANYDSHCIAWTHDTRSATSSGVIIVRRRGNKYEYSAIDRWLEAFCAYKSLVSHPLFPLLVSTVQIMEFIYVKGEKTQAGIRAVESISGFHPWHDRDRVADGLDAEDLDELSAASRSAGSIVVELEDILRQVRLSRRAAAAFDQAMPTTSPMELAEQMVPVVYTLRQQLDSAEDLILYLRERAKNQLTVVSPTPRTPERTHCQLLTS